MKKLKIIATVIFVIVAAALLITKFFFVDFVIVPQNGMYPSISAGRPIFFAKRPYDRVSDVRRGDVVLFDRVEKDGANYRYVWRVIGLPGDQVEVVGESVLINGEGLKRERLRQDGEIVIFRETNSDATYEIGYQQQADVKNQPTASLTIPENHVFVLGDNRYNAVDSRYFGPVPFNSIVGRKL